MLFIVNSIKIVVSLAIMYVSFSSNNCVQTYYESNISKVASDFSESNVDQKRIYVFFSDVYLDDDRLSLCADFYTSDGMHEIVDSSTFDNAGISKNNTYKRVRFFDVKKEYEMASFTIKYNGAEWSNTGLTKIVGSCYEYSTSNYSTINSKSGWHGVSLCCVDFCDVILYNIDPEKESLTDGYLSYKCLNDGFFGKLSDFDDFTSCNPVWIDQFSNEQVDFKTKWNSLKNNYYSKKESNRFDDFDLIKIMGYLVIISCAFLLFEPLIWRKFCERNQKR